MAQLKSVAELARRQLYPNPSDETAISLEEFIETAKIEYAYQLWVINRQIMAETGENTIPTNLLSSEIITVVKNRADISDLNALTSLGNNSWLQSLGNFTCPDGCSYVIMDLNKWKLLCDDDSRSSSNKPVIVIGKEIRFPEGTYEEDGKVDIIFANTGKDLDDDIEIDGHVAGIVRRALIDIYSRKGVEDVTNNSNSNV